MSQPSNEYKRAWRQRNLERCRRLAREQMRRWRAAHPQQVLEYGRRSRAKHRVKRNLRWRTGKYGVTEAAVDGLMRKQRGLCALCQRVLPAWRESNKVHIDHDHVTGRVRGLLCARCNTGLGFFLEDPALLRKAARYVLR